jgi:hypothetical protein
MSTKSASIRSWREKDGVIYFSVISDGTTGEDWIGRLERSDFCVEDYAKQVLRSPDFEPTSGVTTEVAVLRGTLFEDHDRITRKIRAYAGEHKFTPLSAEIACLIREKFTDAEIGAMGLWWVVAMHEPINDSDGDPRLLSVGRSGTGRLLRASRGRLDNKWYCVCGFAFAMSQVGH